jgi:hypothetical protein
MNNHDPFEEFEFKPLTDGLGFHRKATSKLPEMTEAPAKSPIYTPPLQRKSSIPTPPPTQAPMPTTSTVDEILKSLNNRRKYGFEEKEAGKILNTPIETVYKPTTWDFSAALLDLMLIVATYLGSLILLLVVTKVDLFANIYNADSQSMIYLSLGILFVGVSFIYLSMTRLFMGFTPGEWVFDQRLGQPEQLGSASYSLRSFARSMIVIATGFALVPLLSLIFRRDIVGKMLGVELLKKV